MYSLPNEIWESLGKDAYTKVRGEILGTSSGTSSSNWEMNHDNVITNSVTLYTNSATLTSSAYSLNLDDGKVVGLTGADSGSVITADYNYGDIPDSEIQRMITASDAFIEDYTGRTFVHTTGTVEYLNVEKEARTFFLNNYPVLTINSLQINTVNSFDPPVWQTLTEGLGNDYLSNSEDLKIGRIRFIDNFPIVGEDQVKVNYDHGYSSTPSLVNELSILLTLRKMANSSVYKSIFKGHDNFTPVKLTEIENRIEELKRMLKKQVVSLI